MFNNKVYIYLRRALHVNEHCWTLDKPMVSLSTCHLSLWFGWQILLNLQSDALQTFCEAHTLRHLGTHGHNAVK